MTLMNLHINHSTDDLVLASSGVDWIEVDDDLDYFIFSEGSADVADEEAIPTADELNRAATQLSDIASVTVSKYFLADISAAKIKEIFNAGNQNKRYVFACEFDGATASEPQLEAWDNVNMDTYHDPCLGADVASGSWYKAKCTTDALPGADWTGIALAGSGVSNVVLLNAGNGALTIAKNLYFNLKVIIPSGYDIPASHVPILAVVYTTN